MKCSWIVLEHGDFAHITDEILFGIVCECKLNSHVLITLLAVKSLRAVPRYLQATIPKSGSGPVSPPR